MVRGKPPHYNDVVSIAIVLVQMPIQSLTTVLPKRCWPQFSLRTLLLVTLAAACFMAGYSRRLVTTEQVVATQWDLGSGQNVKWAVPLGSQTYSTPAVARGKVFIGSNNSHGYVSRFPSTVDLGVLLCFRETDAKFLWQHSNAKLPAGRVHDWPFQGVCSTPVVDGDRLFYVSNRCEVVCLDIEGFHDGQNDGPFRGEDNEHLDEADVVWKLDMIGSLGVSPHNMSQCRIVSAGSTLFAGTSNGVDESHIHLPNPRAPSFLAIDKKSGRVLWRDTSPGSNILHGQWSSPSYAVLGGVPQVLFPAGDGWLYSFDPRGDGAGNSKLLWKFDCNPKDANWVLGGRGTRNNLIAGATVYEGLVYITVGQEPEHGEGAGHLWCIDPTKRGDVSPELVYNAADPNTPVPHKRWLACDPNEGDYVVANPNSALVWHYTSSDINGNGVIDFQEQFHRSLSQPAIKDDLLVVSDFSGLVHCLDARSGVVYWTHDLLACSWSSPLIAGGHIYVADEDGDIAVFRLSPDPAEAMVLGEPRVLTNMLSSIYATPVAANNVLYIATKNRLFAIDDQARTRKRESQSIFWWTASKKDVAPPIEQPH